MQTTAIPKNHMDIPWHEYSGHGNCPITEADLTEKASIVGRVGLMLLSCGTGAWRVRSSMNTISQNLGITCSTDIGLMSIEYTCFDGTSGFSQSLCLTNTGVNTSKLNRLERFIGEFSTVGKTMTGEQLHDHLDEIDRIHGLYSPVALGFAAALACGAFTFLLGGGPVEMLFAFCGAGLGNFVRCKLTKHHLTLFLGIVASVASACVTYTILLRIAELIAGVSLQHEAGYICSMLFIIPGFPFITSGIDLAKLDMRSGLERLTYAIIIIVVATITAWLMALLLHLHPVDFPALSMSVPMHIILRLVFSFCGVFGFSIMFNSPWKLAATASSPSSEIRASTLAAASRAFRASVWYASSQFMEGARAFHEQTSSSTPFSSVSSAITCTWLRQTLHASTRQDVSSASPFARACTSSVRTCVPAPARKESSIWSSKARFRPEDNAPSLP